MRLQALNRYPAGQPVGYDVDLGRAQSGLADRSTYTRGHRVFEPDKSFIVLAGSECRPASPNPTAVTYAIQEKVRADQGALVGAGVLDDATWVFATEQLFDNWTAASRIVGGNGTFSGAYPLATLV